MKHSKPHKMNRETIKNKIKDYVSEHKGRKLSETTLYGICKIIDGVSDVENQHVYDSSKDKLFFTSDTHFSHDKILDFTNRPFANMAEHDDGLIERWNKAVPEDGVVFHLGDFCFGGLNRWEEIRP